MKNYTKVSILSLLLIFILNTAFAQSATDSTGKKIVKQKKSRVFTRVEMGLPASIYTTQPPTVNLGFELSVTTGYSFSKNFRLGMGAQYLYFQNEYIPVFASVEFGNHTKRVNASLNINVGYALTITDKNVDVNFGAASYNGVLVEVLPTISFGAYNSKQRFRISLGNQFLSTAYTYYPLVLLSPSGRAGQSYGNYRVLETNLLLKFGMDF